MQGADRVRRGVVEAFGRGLAQSVFSSVTEGRRDQGPKMTPTATRALKAEGCVWDTCDPVRRGIGYWVVVDAECREGYKRG